MSKQNKETNSAHQWTQSAATCLTTLCWIFSGICGFAYAYHKSFSLYSSTLWLACAGGAFAVLAFYLSHRNILARLGCILVALLLIYISFRLQKLWLYPTDVSQPPLTESNDTGGRTVFFIASPSVVPAASTAPTSVPPPSFISVPSHMHLSVQNIDIETPYSFYTTGICPPPQTALNGISVVQGGQVTLDHSTISGASAAVVASRTSNVSGNPALIELLDGATVSGNNIGVNVAGSGAHVIVKHADITNNGIGINTSP